jgi:hypothetical protein
LLVALVTAVPGSAEADAGRTTSAPGFRPHSERAASFIDDLGSATIAVHPTVVRGPVDAAYSTSSQNQVVTWLQKNARAKASTASSRMDLGRLVAPSQWALFLQDLDRISESMKAEPTGDDYHLYLAIVAPVSGREIFAIHCYIVDGNGANAFSFLLNSHHRLFIDAKLSTNSVSERAHAKLVQKATDVAMTALEAQLDLARAELRTTKRPAARKAEPGVFDDFESGLPSGRDPSGIELGFLAVHDGQSKVAMAATAPPMPTPDHRAGDKVLKLDFDAVAWAAVVHKFENASVDRWVSYDWSAFDQLSFWMYGQNSGGLIFVDVLDNRGPPYSQDDAEVYVYSFRDDFAGWKKVTIRFRDFRRKEVGNGAPVDGLGLTSAHGWAFGVGSTEGPVTFYLDDFELKTEPSWSAKYEINELPMYGHIQKSVHQLESDQRFIETITSDGRSLESAAQTAAEMGWRFFYEGDRPNAMKRFNQAWLLDPGNQLALWGFAVISAERDQLQEAVGYFQMAVENGPKNPSLQKDYEKALRSLEEQR